MIFARHPFCVRQFSADDVIETITFLSAKEAIAFSSAGKKTVRDILDHLPKRYEDRRRFDAFPNQATTQAVCLRGMILDIQRKHVGRGHGFSEAIVVSGGDNVFSSTKLTLRWFNMPFIHKMLAAGQEIVAFGKVKDNNGRLIIDHPEFEIIKSNDDAHIHIDRIVPIYKNIAGIAQRRLREIIYILLENVVSETLHRDFPISAEFEIDQQFRDVHFPASQETADAARRLFALEEFATLQLQVAWRRKLRDATNGRKQGKSTALLTDFYKSLPFDLTEAQKRCVKEVAADMRSERAMNRLLQGDVGSGKTFVAMCAMLLAVDSGNQAALMAPTQILAEQHYITFKKWLDPLGVRIALRTGNRSLNENIELLGEAQIIIGTHALLYGDDNFKKLSLIVIDEQHKFGVMQRGRLIQQGITPDVLVMTATPIPRTLTMTIYGDLDVSVIDERPRGRGKIISAVRIKPKVSDVTKFLLEHLENDRQAYIVYPLVEESDSVNAESAIVEHEKWVKRLKHFEVDLLHGKVSTEEKEAVMNRFRNQQSQVLVATSVVEVGVDIPNANIMIIYNAERFGLAQLHQLRGRIGRGEHKSYCILVTDGKNPDALEKLNILVETTDGFKIAEADLQLRGPGDVLGTAQSGLADLKFIEYLADIDLLKKARALADGLLQSDPTLVNYPKLRELVMKERDVSIHD